MPLYSFKMISLYSLESDFTQTSWLDLTPTCRDLSIDFCVVISWVGHCMPNIGLYFLKLLPYFVKYFQLLPYNIVTVPNQVVLTLHYANHAQQVESNQIKQCTSVCKLILNCWSKFGRPEISEPIYNTVVKALLATNVLINCSWLWLTLRCYLLLNYG